MKSKQTGFRPVGQRSIDSSFLTYSISNPVSKKEPPLSLSDFLQKKLKQTPELPTTGKSKPFSSLLGLRESEKGVLSDEKGEAMSGEKPEVSSDAERVVLQQFKPVCVAPSSIGEAESSDTTDGQGSRKRAFEGVYETQTPRKRFTDFSGALKRKQPRRVKTATEEDQIPVYNHYANGRGWWDSDMEGVDNEEVGFGEVWEGVGSTTFGDIVDWH